jgi:hypothetical protein
MPSKGDNGEIDRIEETYRYKKESNFENFNKVAQLLSFEKVGQE